MIKGIGIDIVEIKRIQTIMDRQPKFQKRVLTEKELELYEALTSNGRKTEFLAGRFAAKEAFAKAKGTGFGKELGFHDIEILRNELGKPVVHFTSNGEETIHISISHSSEYAVAQVILEEK